MHKHLTALLAGTALATTTASANLIDTTPSVFPLGPFSDSSLASWGQTFLSPGSASTLESYELNLEIFSAGEFSFHVAEWTGTQVGTLLYDSGTLNAPVGIFSQNFALSLDLAPNTSLIAFVNNSNYRNSGLPLDAGVGVSGVDYPDGALLFQDSGSDFSKVSTEPWSSSGVDSAFKAQFTTVPEGEHIGLTAGIFLGAMVVISRLRRNKQAV